MRIRCFWFFPFLVRICSRFSRPRKISARNFPFWLTNVRLFYTDLSFRTLSICRFCLKLQWLGDSRPPNDTHHFLPTQSLLLADSCVSSSCIVSYIVTCKKLFIGIMHIVTKYGIKYNCHLKNYGLSCKQLSQDFNSSLSYFDFTGAADPVVFLLIF
jgi:hypothetical protein